MENKKWFVIGLMSGTSLDGLDLVYVKIELNKGYHFEILETEAVNYSDIWKNRLKDAFGFSGEKLTFLDAQYGKFLGQQVEDFIQKKSIEKIDFIASHGHTIFHDPGRGYTLQIGNGAQLSATTKRKVICDFRTQDVALGGQGAPLVPIGDQLLFSHYDFCLNLGGFANISYQKEISRIAYDICAVNIVLNHFTRLNGLEYDDGGKMASEGKVNKDLLHELNSLGYYKEMAPKSLGYEFVIETQLPLIEKYELSLPDILATCVEHSAVQIAEIVNQVVTENEGAQYRMLITGGGAYNTYLIERIKDLCAVDVIIPSKEIIEFKEALIFALLGVLRNEGQVNCLKSVTGASHDHSGGQIYNY
ncbi:anhydro-N-acetylmuramic acid kinase [Lutimonas sp.]|uniref:anhydro-N-acetylmuramic acid kinase n=1 Tax=Lutimonas sp. TaxID=1872403 RepID=UPI003D9AEB68